MEAISKNFIINLRAKRGGSLFDLAFVGDKGVTASSAVFSRKVVRNLNRFGRNFGILIFGSKCRAVVSLVPIGPL